MTQNSTYTRLDPLTTSGFAEIAKAFGRERAFECRIATLTSLVARDDYFRWTSLRWQRALDRAVFERDWQRANLHLIDACPELFAVHGV